MRDVSDLLLSPYRDIRLENRQRNGSSADRVILCVRGRGSNIDRRDRWLFGCQVFCSEIWSYEYEYAMNDSEVARVCDISRTRFADPAIDVRLMPSSRLKMDCC